MSNEEQILVISDSEDEKNGTITISDSEDDAKDSGDKKRSRVNFYYKYCLKPYWKFDHMSESDNSDTESSHENKKPKKSRSEKIQQNSHTTHTVEQNETNDDNVVEIVMYLDGNQLRDENGVTVYKIVTDDENDLENITENIKQGLSYEVITKGNDNEHQVTENINDENIDDVNKTTNDETLNISTNIDQNEENDLTVTDETLNEAIENKENDMNVINSDINKNETLNTKKNQQNDLILSVPSTSKTPSICNTRYETNSQDPSDLLSKFIELLNSTVVDETEMVIEPNEPSNINSQLNSLMDVLEDPDFMTQLDKIEALQNSVVCNHLEPKHDITWYRKRLKKLQPIRIRNVNQSIRITKPLVHYRCGNTVYKTVWIIGILMGSAVKTIKNEISFVVNDGDDTIKCLYTKSDVEKMASSDHLIKTLENCKKTSVERKKRPEVELFNVFMSATTSMHNNVNDKSKGIVLQEKNVRSGRHISVIGNVSEYFEEKVIYVKHVQRLDLRNYDSLAETYYRSLEKHF